MKVNSLTVVSTGKARVPTFTETRDAPLFKQTRDTQGAISRMAEPQLDPSKAPDAEQEDSSYWSLSP